MLTNWKRLNKKQLQHLGLHGVSQSKGNFEAMRAEQKELEASVPRSHCCPECDEIDRVLNAINVYEVTRTVTEVYHVEAIDQEQAKTYTDENSHSLTMDDRITGNWKTRRTY